MCVKISIAGILDDGSALHWSEVSASSLLGIGVDNEIVENGSLGGQPEESAACIHLGLRRIQPRAKVLLLALRSAAYYLIFIISRSSSIRTRIMPQPWDASTKVLKTST